MEQTDDHDEAAGAVDEQVEARRERRRTRFLKIGIAIGPSTLAILVVLIWPSLWGCIQHWRTGPTPQPTHPHVVVVDGKERIVTMALSGGPTMACDPPFRLSICSDGTVVSDIGGVDAYDVESPDAPVDEKWWPRNRSVERLLPAQLARLERAFADASFDRAWTNYSRYDCSDCCWSFIYRYDRGVPRLVALYDGDTSIPDALKHLEREFRATFGINRRLEAVREDRWEEDNRRERARREPNPFEPQPR